MFAALFETYDLDCAALSDPTQTAENTDFDAVDAKTSLILTASRLFAHSGINGVSMRKIAEQAGQGNHFAVQYHFGSREGLVQAIFDYHMEQMEPMRGDMLKRVIENDLTSDAHSLLEIIMLPQLHVDGKDDASYGNFLSQYLLRREWVEYGVFGHEAPPNLHQALTLLRKRVHYLPSNVAQRRLVGVSLMFLNLLVRRDQRKEANEEAFNQALKDTMDQIVMAMCLPLRI